MQDTPPYGVKSPPAICTGQAIGERKPLSEIIVVLNDQFGKNFTEMEGSMPIEVGIWRVGEQLERINYSKIESEQKLEDFLSINMKTAGMCRWTRPFARNFKLRKCQKS